MFSRKYKVTLENDRILCFESGLFGSRMLNPKSLEPYGNGVSFLGVERGDGSQISLMKIRKDPKSLIGNYLDTNICHSRSPVAKVEDI